MTIAFSVSNVPILLSFGGGCFSEAARSSLVDVDDGLCKGLRRLLRQVVAYAASDVSMLVPADVPLWHRRSGQHAVRRSRRPPT